MGDMAGYYLEQMMYLFDEDIPLTHPFCAYIGTSVDAVGYKLDLLKNRKKWQIKDGSLIKLKKLDDNHLRNIIKYLEFNFKEAPEVNEMLKILRKEENKRRRKLTPQLKRRVVK